VNQKLLTEAEEFIIAQAEYVAMPQLDGTDDSSPDDCHSNIPLHSPTPIHYHASLPWLYGTLPWRGVKAVTSRCAHVNPLRNFCDSAVFPQKPAATHIAVMNVDFSSQCRNIGSDFSSQCRKLPTIRPTCA